MDRLVHPHERLYLILSLIVSALIYLVMLISIVGIVYIIFGALALFLLQGLSVGHVRGNAVEANEQQLPAVHAKVVELSAALGMGRTPEVYILQAGGVLNAFATRFLGRNMIVIYSEILELAYEQGEDEVSFVIAHELAHLQRNHPFWRMLVAPAMFIPFLGNAYSRACEYTCDAIGASIAGDGAVNGLLVLASGKRIYREITAGLYVAQMTRTDDFWVKLAERLATHPRLPKRIARITSMVPIQNEAAVGVLAY